MLIPMKLKSEAHEALFLLFQQDGVPSAVICSNAKDMILGEFNRKLKEASCHLRQKEPFTPWSNAARREIKTLMKKGFSRKLIRSGTPKRLWDDCLEFDSYIRYNTAHGIYKLDGEVPETFMSTKMTDTSQFCEFEWFEWVKFQDETAPYLNHHFRLGGYLGLSLNIDSALMEKIIKENSQSSINPHTEQ